ncbi:MAG: hypothetical protein IPM66_05965 [Acidobacteriota bacterium]|nr:MAG: hypothetical protein IPM66_05965 [Acidobacteriota bacterium]
MKKKETTTAAELMARLQNTPDFLNLQREREREFAVRDERYKLLEAPIVRELNAIGIDVDSLHDLVRAYAPLSIAITDILLKWLQQSTDEIILEHLVRALGASQIDFNGKPLVNLFEKTRSSQLRWAIANTISEARPSNITDWILNAVSNQSYGKSREMLILAIAQLASPHVSNSILVNLFDEFPGHVSAALAISGRKKELEFLKEKCKISKGWVKREIIKAIQSIEKRLKE